jgi:hypothetical protein
MCFPQTGGNLNEMLMCNTAPNQQSLKNISDIGESFKILSTCGYMFLLCLKCCRFIRFLNGVCKFCILFGQDWKEEKLTSDD